MPNYPNPEPRSTPSLMQKLQAEIASRGPISFTEFMERALYHPEQGYYARTSTAIGRSGDFFTSVSVGPVFGELLARRFLTEWCAAGKPPRWRLIELGAHDGSLAADILTTFQSMDSALFHSVEYVIAEPLAGRAELQRRKLNEFRERVRIVNSLEGLADDPIPGLAFGNELLDALPFHVVEWRNGWTECRVGLGPDQTLCWSPGHFIDHPDINELLSQLGDNLPEGYRTEVRVNVREIMEPLLQCLSHGLLIWVDYGFARPEFYHPDRTNGTLRTFSNHQAGDDPLVDPGGCDITAHVDFTAVAENAIALGMKVAAFQNQGHWLTAVARPWLLALEGHPDPEKIGQFRTLIHPAHLGSRFHVLELAWNEPVERATAADFHRLALKACPPACGP